MYKSGTYSNVSLNVGTDYATLLFKRETNPDVVIATQYVARNVETYVDRVVIDGAKIEDQLWLKPTVENENENEVYVFYEASHSSVKVGLKDSYDILMLSHLHTICGNRYPDTEAHIDGSKHTEVVNFIQVKNENEILRNVNSGYKYFVLATNVEITRAMTLPDNSSICLNGYELRIRRGVKAISLGSGESVTITDCKMNVHDGKRTTGEDRDLGYSVEQNAIEVTRGTMILILPNALALMMALS